MSGKALIIHVNYPDGGIAAAAVVVLWLGPEEERVGKTACGDVKFRIVGAGDERPSPDIGFHVLIYSALTGINRATKKRSSPVLIWRSRWGERSRRRRFRRGPSASPIWPRRRWRWGTRRLGRRSSGHRRSART